MVKSDINNNDDNNNNKLSHEEPNRINNKSQR